jgi:hypothetical protein
MFVAVLFQGQLPTTLGTFAQAEWDRSRNSQCSLLEIFQFQLVQIMLATPLFLLITSSVFTVPPTVLLMIFVIFVYF